MSYGILYIGGIPGNFSERDVLSYFQQFTPLAKFTMITSPARSLPNSYFGYLMLPADAIGEVRSYQHYFGEQRIVCEEYLGDERSSNLRNSLKRRRVFVRNIKKNISDDDLHRVFSKFGAVESAFIIKDHLTGKSRSFGYVTFQDEQPAFALVAKGTLLIKGFRVFIHAFEKNLHETLEFIQSKAEENHPQTPPRSAQSSKLMSDGSLGGSFKMISSSGHLVSTNRVQNSSFLPSKNISPSRSDENRHSDHPHLFSQEYIFNIRRSQSSAANDPQELYSETLFSNGSFLNSRQPGHFPTTATYFSSVGQTSLNNKTLTGSIHVKPTSIKYDHERVSKVLRSSNLRFNRLSSAVKTGFVRM